jgi:hypothetical protein
MQDRSAPIPEQVDRAPEMPEQVLEKRSDVQAAEVPWAAPEVQCHAPALRRHRHATTDGEANVAIAVANAGGLPARPPAVRALREPAGPVAVRSRRCGSAPPILRCSHRVRAHRRLSLQRQTRSKTCPRISPTMSRATHVQPMRPWVSVGGGSSGGSTIGSPAAPPDGQRRR